VVADLGGELDGGEEAHFLVRSGVYSECLDPRNRKRLLRGAAS
jgi:hypothetical protein